MNFIINHRKILTVAFFIIIPYAVYSQHPYANIDNSNSNSLTLNVNVPALDIHKITYPDGNIYDCIFQQGAKLHDGMPDLPAITKRILIPKGTHPVITVHEGQPLIYEDIKIPPVKKYTVNDSCIFSQNQFVYSSDEFFPDIFAELDPISNYRDNNIGMLWMYPFHYNPVSRTLKVYPEMHVEITFTGIREPIKTSVCSKYYDDLLSSVTINGDDIINSRIYDDNGSKSNDGCEFLIITHDDFEDAAYTLADWRKKYNNISCKVVTTSEINSSYDTWIDPDNPEQTNSTNNNSARNAIDDYIDSAYNNWSTVPSFMLILGDAEFIPPWYEFQYANYFAATDYYFADVDNDLDNGYSPEFLYGRIPVDNVTVALNLVKALKVHDTISNASSFYNRIMGCSEYQSMEIDDYNWENGRFTQTVEEINQYLTSSNFKRVYYEDVLPGMDTVNYYWTPDSSNFNKDILFENDYEYKEMPDDLQNNYPSIWKSDSSDIITRLNADPGTFLAIYHGHGYSEFWEKPNFDKNDLDDLDYNVNNYPLIWALSCETGWFDNETDSSNGTLSECFTEEWIRANGDTTGGAVGIFAATRTIPTIHGARLLWGMMDAYWPGFIDHYINDNYGPLSYNGKRYLGTMVSYAKNYVETKFSSSIDLKSIMATMHWFGDPTMEFIPSCSEDLLLQNITVDTAETIDWQASDSIVVAGEGTSFTVEYGGTSNLGAEHITLKKGFHAKSGSQFSASLNPCDQIDLFANNIEKTGKILEIKKQKIIQKINEGKELPNFIVFPNPNQGEFSVYANRDIIKIEIFNLIGEKIQSNVVNNKNQQKIHLSGNSKGIYFVIIYTDKQRITRKVMIE